jgi:hypothetical protein
MPTRNRGRRLAWIPLAAGSLITACVRPSFIPPADVVERARSAASYNGRLRVSLDGPDLRARTAVLVAFERPDALRVEVPGPSGARLIAVARGGTLTAVFPAERAVFEGEATPAGLAQLLGVSLAPAEVMDLLVGAQPSRVRGYSARWGPALPRHVEATLPDGGRLKVAVEDAEAGRALPSEAFAPPRHEGYRSVDAAEARQLWSR